MDLIKGLIGGESTFLPVITLISALVILLTWQLCRSYFFSPNPSPVQTKKQVRVYGRKGLVKKSQEECACKNSSSLEACCKSSPTSAQTCTIPESPRRECIALKLEGPIHLFYATRTNTARSMANRLADEFEQRGITCVITDLSTFDPEDLFSLVKSLTLDQSAVYAPALLVIPSYDQENSPSEPFLKWLLEARHDFRIGKAALSSLRFALWSIGDSAYGSDRFGQSARQVDQALVAMAAKRIFPMGVTDVAGAEAEVRISGWVEGYLDGLLSMETILPNSTTATTTTAVGEDVVDSDDDVSESDPEEEAEEEGSNVEMDLEELGSIAAKLEKAKQQRQHEQNSALEQSFGPKKKVGVVEKAMAKVDMVNEKVYKSLTKQGYRVIGSHSGVKMCRWTKAALRGRGFCYKNAFYGIKSHLCMETTPSLACANKCVFCWRHHTNPVGTEWKWNMDEPEMILKGAMESHYKMIKEMKGVPGVKIDRYQEAFQIKHCALSLVGEPIMYPKINKYIELLHENDISTFLVTNAQFPERVRELVPVTQLYLSVDASTKESLKKIDRPLFRDFWERFLDCLDALREKQQRTVYRLTLVKEFNTEEVRNYAQLIHRGEPDFVEIKGVTFCGYSGSSPLTMANVPFHEEVVRFANALLQDSPEGQQLQEKYAISCEHAHSCSILIAHRKFYQQEKWHTWIDYDRFQELVKSKQKFTSLDYCKETPDWALYGNPERGFAPSETRFYRNKTKKVVD